MFKITQKDLKRSLISILLGTIVIVLTVYFLGGLVAKNWDVIREQTFRVKIGWLLLGSVFYFLYFASKAFLWQKIFQRLHHHVRYRKLLETYLLSQPPKYIPGKIFMYIYRAHVLEKEKLPYSTTFYSAGIETVVEIVIGSAIGSFILFRYIGSYELALIGMAIVVVCGIVLLSPPLFSRITNFYFKFFKKPLIPEETWHSSGRTFVILAIETFAILSFSLSHFFMLKSIYILPAGNFLEFVSITSLSFIAGIAIFFAPSGFGVREGILLFFLPQFMPVETAIVFTAGSRLWLILSELVFFGLAHTAARVLGDVDHRQIPQHHI